MSSPKSRGRSKSQDKKGPGRNRLKKEPGTPFFDIDPVISLETLDQPKPKVSRRVNPNSRFVKRPVIFMENRAPNLRDVKVADTTSMSSSLITQGEPLASSPSSDARRTNRLSMTKFGEGSLSSSVVTDGEPMCENLTDNGQEATAGELYDDSSSMRLSSTDLSSTAIGVKSDHPSLHHSIGFAINEGTTHAEGHLAHNEAAQDEFASVPGVSHSTMSTRMECNESNPGLSSNAPSSQSYLNYSSSTVPLLENSSTINTKVWGAIIDNPILNIPVPEEYPSSPIVTSRDLMEPLLTYKDDSAFEVPEQQGGWRSWLCFLWCFP